MATAQKAELHLQRHYQIAERLSLSQKTVETYRARLVEKLGIRDVAGLVCFAIQRGIVSLD